MSDEWKMEPGANQLPDQNAEKSASGARKRLLRKFRIKLVCFALILILVMIYGIYILTPKYDYGICPMINLYLQPKNSVDVLVVGTSVAYAGVNTNVLWREHGWACYDLCSAEIPFWSSYYQLKEALRYQKPQLILLDAKAVVYSQEYTRKGRTILSTFGILHPDYRIQAIMACQETTQSVVDFVWAYPEVHKYYKSLGLEDFVLPPNNGGRGINWKGYMELDNIESQTKPTLRQTAKKIQVNERQVEYYRKILELAQDEGIPILVIGFPCPNYDEEMPHYRVLWDVAEEYGVQWIDYNLLNPSSVLDYETDFADLHHLNVKGGMKLTLWLGEDLLSRYDLPDRRGDPAYATYDLCADAWYDKLDGFISKPREGEI